MLCGPWDPNYGKPLMNKFPKYGDLRSMAGQFGIKLHEGWPLLDSLKRMPSFIIVEL